MKINVQFITTPAGEELAILPRSEFDALVRAAEDALEDAADEAAAAAAMADPAGMEPMPALVTALVLKGTPLLRAIRQWRDLQQQPVALFAGISQGHLSDLETGRRSMTPKVRARLATALDVPEAWLP